MTQPSPNPHMALYSKLMWPGWNPLAERQGTTDAEAERLIAEHRAAVLREAADAIDDETQAAKSAGVLEPDKFRPCRDASDQLRRMADGSQP